MGKNNHFDSHSVMEVTIGRDTTTVSKSLNMNEGTIRKWKEPLGTKDNDESGARNPLDRLEIIMETIAELDGNTDRAHKPIEWLCDRFGYLPPIKTPDVELNDIEMVQAVLKWNKEFGDTCTVISATLEDGKVAIKEYKDCHKEAHEGIQALLQLLKLMESKIES